MITTHVIWAPGTPTQAQRDAIAVYVRTLVEQAATDGQAVVAQVPQGQQITRTWRTVNDATTWITYIADFNPISAELVE